MQAPATALDHYTILVGQEFWHRLTGDTDFYFELIRSLAYVAKEFDGTALFDKTINELAKTYAVKKLSNHFECTL